MAGYSDLAAQYAQIMADNKRTVGNAVAKLRAMKEQQDEEDAMPQGGEQQMMPVMAPGQGMQRMQLQEPGQLSYGGQMGPRRFR